MANDRNRRHHKARKQYRDFLSGATENKQRHLEVQQYKLTVQYVKGKANAVADALSRSVPVDGEMEEAVNPGEDKIVCMMNEGRGRAGWVQTQAA
ncbi:hypothetical protein OSTOST_01429 [Ostertagia ostertagi]